jgi:hypothetical protein
VNILRSVFITQLGASEIKFFRIGQRLACLMRAAQLECTFMCVCVCVCVCVCHLTNSKQLALISKEVKGLKVKLYLNMP